MKSLTINVEPLNKIDNKITIKTDGEDLTLYQEIFVITTLLLRHANKCSSDGLGNYKDILNDSLDVINKTIAIVNNNIPLCEALALIAEEALKKAEAEFNEVGDGGFLDILEIVKSVMKS